MTDPITPPEPPDPVMVDPALDQLGLVSLFLTEMRAMKAELKAAIDENEKARKERWSGHEQEHGRLARQIDTLELSYKEHVQQERDEDMVMEARLGPVRRAGTWLIREWRTVAIVLLLVADFVAQLDLHV